MLAGDLSANIERFSGFADLYDRYRPGPPAVLAPLLAQYAKHQVPSLVVDLGSGTGLATRYWADHAKAVIGIEPAVDMRRLAEARTPMTNVSYREGVSHHTGLPDHCAQIVSCSQSLHWMEPAPTFHEAARILQPGGVFSANDYDWPPVTGVWEAEAAYEDCMRTIRSVEKDLGLREGLRFWDKEGHLARMEASDCFRHCREIVIHHAEPGNAERFVGVLLSQGNTMALIKKGVTEAELGIDRLRDVAGRTLGPKPQTWHWSARVRIGIV